MKYCKALLLVSWISLSLYAAGDGYQHVSNYSISEDGRHYNVVSGSRPLSAVQQDAIYKIFNDNIENTAVLKRLIRKNALDLVRYKNLRVAVLYLIQSEYDRLVAERDDFITSRLESCCVPDVIKDAYIGKCMCGATFFVGGIFVGYSSLLSTYDTMQNNHLIAAPFSGIGLALACALLFKGGTKMYEAYNHVKFLNKKIHAMKCILDQINAVVNNNAH
ncbi:MAG: hypothetical protein WC707_03785 [Candidatus Babeliaceae bacterium]|jgi:hypothetical protein